MASGRVTRDAVGACVADALAVMAGARCLPALHSGRVGDAAGAAAVMAGARCLPALHPCRVGDAAGAAALTRRQASQSASRAVTQYPIVFFFSNISLAVSGR